MLTFGQAHPRMVERGVLIDGALSTECAKGASRYGWWLVWFEMAAVWKEMF